MKKFALLALVLAFGGLMLAGCPDNTAANKGSNTPAPSNTPSNTPSNG